MVGFRPDRADGRMRQFDCAVPVRTAPDRVPAGHAGTDVPDVPLSSARLSRYVGPHRGVFLPAPDDDRLCLAGQFANADGRN